MPSHIERPVTIEAAGNVAKIIEEFIGGASTGTTSLSIAHMQSPAGWEEPGQRPEFDEYTIVLSGRLIVEYADGEFEIRAGQAIHARPGEWVRYRSPEPEGADYISVCVPAFSPGTVHRDA
jgi:mannose-6-phosphate isomerase-like protein (cupin superfamily)